MDMKSVSKEKENGHINMTKECVIIKFKWIVMFSLIFSSTKDTSLNGYFIPKDTCVFINQWQINHDS